MNFPLATCACVLLGQMASANPFLDQVTTIWEAGATEMAGLTLPRPEESKGAAMFACADCDTPFVIFIATDTLMEGYGTTDPDEVIARNRACEDDDRFPCEVEAFEFDGLRAVQTSSMLLDTETITTRYFQDNGVDFVLTVMRPDDGIEDAFPLIRALEDSYLRPLLAQQEAN